MKLLDRYIETTALRGFVLVALALTSLLSMLGFVEQLQDVGKGTYHVTDALVFVLLTAPSRLLGVIPTSGLIGSLVALGGLANNRELIVMQAVGVSALRIIWAVLKLGALIMVALFLMSEFIVPPAQQLAETKRALTLSPSSALRSDNGFWARGADGYLNVRHFLYDSIPTDIDIYNFDALGNLKSLIHAKQADIRSDGTWILTGVRRTIFANQRVNVEHIETLPWKSFLRPQQAKLLVLAPDSMAPTALYHYVHDLENRHQYTARYKQALWDIISIPLATAAMILLAVPFIFGSPRTHSAGQRIVTGSIIGIGFYLINQITGYTGLLIDLNPAITATIPSLILLLAAAYFLRRFY